jgi:hypothetical protein
VLDEEGAQLAPEALALVKLDEEGGDERRARVGSGAGPGAGSVALGEVLPGEGAEEKAILLHNRVLGDPSREWSVGVSERAGREGVGVGRTRRLGPQRGREPVERGGKLR